MYFTYRYFIALMHLFNYKFFKRLLLSSAYLR